MSKFKNKKITRALIVCDSFKGSLSSEEVGRCIQAALKNKGIPSDYLLVSDGGEGFLDALKFGRPSLEKHYLPTCDSLFRKIDGLFLKDGDTLYFSLADVVGLFLLKAREVDAYRNSTYGLGYLMRQAINAHRPKNVVLSLGGSCTNDLGLGFLEGLGAKVFDGDKQINRVTLKDFDRITRIDLTDVLDLTSDIKFTTLTDVGNPLCGERGATKVYGEQKGLQKSELERVDNMLAGVKDLILSAANNAHDPSNNSGSGAAGGVGFTVQAVFRSEIKSGIDELLKTIEFGERIKKYDLVITGEGCFDEQSLNGKVVCGVMKYGIQNLVIVSAIKKLEYLNAYSIVPDITTKKNSMKEPKKYLAELIDRIF